MCPVAQLAWPMSSRALCARSEPRSAKDASPLGEWLGWNLFTSAPDHRPRLRFSGGLDAEWWNGVFTRPAAVLRERRWVTKLNTGGRRGGP